MDKFVFFLMEIKNDFSQYGTKRRQAQDSLDLLKRSFKSMHPSEGHSDSNTSLEMSPSVKLSPQALVLCRSLYRMHFQFLVFLGSYNKLLGTYSLSQLTFLYIPSVARYRRELAVCGGCVRHFRSAGTCPQKADSVPIPGVNPQVRGGSPGKEIHVWVSWEV